MLKMTVNGETFDNLDTLYLCNTGPESIFVLDLFFNSTSGPAMEWLLSTNGDGSAKIRLAVDIARNSGTVETIYDIKEGFPGESFSNPIVWNRPSILPFDGNENVVDADYEWVLNNGKKQDSIKLRIIKNTNTSQSDFDVWMRFINLSVQESQFMKLKDNYLYLDVRELENINIKF